MFERSMRRATGMSDRGREREWGLVLGHLRLGAGSSVVRQPCGREEECNYVNVILVLYYMRLAWKAMACTCNSM